MHPDGLMASATRVIVVHGANYDVRRRKNNDVLAVVDAPKRLTALAAALVVGDERDRTSLMSPGHPTLAIFAGDQLLSTYSLLGVTWLRSPAWVYDRPVTHPPRLLAWLAESVPKLGYSPTTASGGEV